MGLNAIVVLACVLALAACVPGGQGTAVAPPPGTDTRPKVVVFVHGYTGGERTWPTLPRLIKEDPDLAEQFRVHVWDYPTDLLRPENPKLNVLSGALRTLIEEGLASHKDVFLVGHSLGGLLIKSYVIRSLMEGRAKALKRIRGAFREVRDLDVLLTGNAQSTLARYCAVVLDVSVREEACPMNLAPTSSTTAAPVAPSESVVGCTIASRDSSR